METGIRRGNEVMEVSSDRAIDTRALPISGQWWISLGSHNGPRELPVPVGLPVHNVVAGRVVSIDRLAVGAVVVASKEFHYHYRRLQGSSIEVKLRDEIALGTVIGAVARPADGSVPVFEFAVQDPSGEWIDPFPLLAGAADPSDYRLATPDRGPDPMATGVEVSRPAEGSAPPVREIDLGERSESEPIGGRSVEIEPDGRGSPTTRGLVAARPTGPPSTRSDDRRPDRPPSAAVGWERHDEVPAVESVPIEDSPARPTSEGERSGPGAGLAPEDDVEAPADDRESGRPDAVADEHLPNDGSTEDQAGASKLVAPRRRRRAT